MTGTYLSFGSTGAEHLPSTVQISCSSYIHAALTGRDEMAGVVGLPRKWGL
jgi:hypothetical protein